MYMRIRKAREHAGLTKSELAELVGVSPQAVTNWEHEDAQMRKPPTEVNLRKIAAVCGVDLPWLERGGKGAPVVADEVFRVYAHSKKALLLRDVKRELRRLAPGKVAGLNRQVTFPGAPPHRFDYVSNTLVLRVLLWPKQAPGVRAAAELWEVAITAALDARAAMGRAHVVAVTGEVVEAVLHPLQAEASQLGIIVEVLQTPYEIAQLIDRAG